MAITKKQNLLIAAILALGMAAGAAVMLTGNKPGSGAESSEQEHADEHGHDDDKGRHEEAGHKDETSEKEPNGPSKVQSGGGGAASNAEAKHEEGVLKLDEARTKAAAIAVTSVGPAKLQAAQEFPGEVKFNEDRTAHVVPRLAGVSESVQATIGQLVRRGQVLAVIASTSLSDQRSELLAAQRRLDAARVTYERERGLWQEKISAQQDFLQAQTALREAEIAVANSRQKLAAVGAPAASIGLNRFEVRAPFDGTVVEKHLTLGEAVKEDASIFTISDLNTVWAEFAVSPKDLGVVRLGQKVVVSSSASSTKVQGVISYVGALLGEQTRTARVRATLANPQGAWRPGLFVTVSVLGSEQEVLLAVPAEAIQSVENRPSVFKAVPGGFRATPVQPGRSDGRNVEILGGLQAGEKVATSNAFVLKAEMGKSSTTHGH